MNEEDLSKVCDLVKRRFLSSIISDTEESRREIKGEEIQITDICYDCMRRAYYQVISRANEDNKGVRLSDWLVIWTGVRLHQTDFSEVHELDVYGMGVHGRIDELMINEDKAIIVDKKTTRKIPSKPYDHHVKQVQYYAVLLKSSEVWEMLKDKKMYGCVLYIDVNLGAIEAFPFVVNPNDAAIEREMREKITILQKALNERKPPEPKMSWLCQYCDFLFYCVRDEDVVR
jgi:CRISPR/Cas system-associated exonuclease Cas4 (RecB family)